MILVVSSGGSSSGIQMGGGRVRLLHPVQLQQSQTCLLLTAI